MSKEPDISALLEQQREAEAQATAERKLHRATTTAAEWRALARVYMREADEANKRLEAALALSEPCNPKPIEPIAKKGDKHSPSTACIVASDWHIDERVRPQDVPGGRNRYSPEIAEQRLENLWQRSVKMIDAQRSSTSINNAVLLLLGDLFSGWIHEELRSSTEMSPIDSVLWLQPRIVAGIDYLAKHGDFERLDIACIVGNHSRITTKQHAVPASASLETILYRWLASHYQEHLQVRFHLTNATRVSIPVGQVHLRYHHGDAWRYQGGVGGVIVPMMRLTQKWSLTERADHDTYGHWHTYQPGPRSTGNGSLIGYNAYGALHAPYEPPQQALFLISHKFQRVTVQAPIFVE